MRYLSFPQGVHFEVGDYSEFLVTNAKTSLKVCKERPYLREGLLRLGGAGVVESELEEMIFDRGGPDGLARWFHQLQSLACRGMLLISVRNETCTIATLAPIAGTFRYQPARMQRSQSYIMSRFSYIRRLGSELVLESPTALARITLHHESAIALAFALAKPIDAASLISNEIPSVGDGALASELLGLFIEAGVVADANGNGREEGDADRTTWEFHDLLFHARSRSGRHDYSIGGTYSHADMLPAPSALKVFQSESTLSIDLYKPNLEEIQKRELPYCVVQEKRRSIRQYAETPISALKLGEFLFRVARVRDGVITRTINTPKGPKGMDFAARPYPGGGMLHELELYAAVNKCEGLSAGLYYYDPLGHRLRSVQALTPDVQGLIDCAGHSSQIDPADIQVLLILTTRHQRISWKYASISYAVTLKNVGVLYQTMYLAATAMDLAPCALGGGNSDLFARASHVDYYEETSVGEFLLGSKHTSKLGLRADRRHLPRETE